MALRFVFNIDPDTNEEELQIFLNGKRYDPDEDEEDFTIGDMEEDPKRYLEELLTTEQFAFYVNHVDFKEQILPVYFGFSETRNSTHKLVIDDPLVTGHEILLIDKNDGSQFYMYEYEEKKYSSRMQFIVESLDDYLSKIVRGKMRPYIYIDHRRYNLFHGDWME